MQSLYGSPSLCHQLALNCIVTSTQTRTLVVSIRVSFSSRWWEDSLHCTSCGSPSLCHELYCHKHPNKNTGGEHKGFILLTLVRRLTSLHIMWFSETVPPAIHCTELYCHKHLNKETGGEHCSLGEAVSGWISLHKIIGTLSWDNNQATSRPDSTQLYGYKLWSQ